MSDTLNHCPEHGRFTGTNCTYCDWPPIFSDDIECTEAFERWHGTRDNEFIGLHNHIKVAQWQAWKAAWRTKK